MKIRPAYKSPILQAAIPVPNWLVCAL